MKREVHCWEDGPRDEDYVGSTCMLLDGHEGPHEFMSDSRIGVVFAPLPSAQPSPLPTPKQERES